MSLTNLIYAQITECAADNWSDDEALPQYRKTLPDKCPRTIYNGCLSTSESATAGKIPLSSQ